MVWIGKHRGFTVRQQICNDVTKSRWRGFIIPRHDGVPGANTIQLWIKRLEETDITRKT